MYRGLFAWLQADIQDAHVFVIEQHLVMLRVDLRRVLRFRYTHSQDRDAPQPPTGAGEDGNFRGG